MKVVIDIRVHPARLAELRKLAEVAVVADAADLQAQRRDLPREALADADMLVCTLPPKNFAEAAALKLVQLGSVGYSQLYGLGLVERGIRACNARGVYDTAIAEWVVAMMINLARDLRTMIRNQDQRLWTTEGRFQNEIRGSVLGIWGYGGIGRETARLAKALGLTVHAYARHGIGPREGVYLVPGTGDPQGTLPDRVFQSGQEIEFLKDLDFLVLAMPLTPASRGSIGERELRALKPSAFLLNPARGPLIEEAALLKALDNGWITGAALDTHYHYPLPENHPLWKIPNVILTPHIAGSDQGPHYLQRMWQIVLHNARNFLAGEPLCNELTADELNGLR